MISIAKFFHWMGVFGYHWIGLPFSFSFLVFWSRLVLNWRCGWPRFGCTDLLLNPMRWCWLWYRHPLRWYRRWDWWYWHALILNREVDMWKIRCWSCNWKNYSGFLVDCPNSSSILTSVVLVMSPYSSDVTTDGVFCRM